jgi:hypothetical protein
MPISDCSSQYLLHIFWGEFRMVLRKGVVVNATA